MSSEDKDVEKAEVQVKFATEDEAGQVFNDTYDAAFSPDGKRVATMTLSRVYLWEASSGKLLARLGVPSLKAIAFSPDGSRLANASDDALVRLWNVEEVLKECAEP